MFKIHVMIIIPLINSPRKPVERAIDLKTFRREISSIRCVFYLFFFFILLWYVYNTVFRFYDIFNRGPRKLLRPNLFFFFFWDIRRPLPGGLWARSTTLCTAVIFRGAHGSTDLYPSNLFSAEYFIFFSLFRPAHLH